MMNRKKIFGLLFKVKRKYVFDCLVFWSPSPRYHAHTHTHPHTHTRARARALKLKHTHTHRHALNLYLPMVSFGRNWCQYTVSKTVSCQVHNGTEKLVQRMFQSCRWPGPCSNLIRYEWHSLTHRHRPFMQIDCHAAPITTSDIKCYDFSVVLGHILSLGNIHSCQQARYKS